MADGVSMTHAAVLARNARETCTATRRINEAGRLTAEIEVDVREARLRVGRDQRVRVVLFELGSVGEGGTPRPIKDAHSRRAKALCVTVHPREGTETVTIPVDAEVAEHAGEWVEIAVERVSRAKAIVATLFLIALLIAALLLSPWSDPNAKHGHLPNKSDEEIQADIDTDVAWYQMEISVASRAIMQEGDTEVALNIENLEANHCDQKVKVFEEGNPDDVLFASGALEPGTYLETVQLAHPLEVGNHRLTVEFQGYEHDVALITSKGQPLSHEPFGSPAAATVEVVVFPTEA